mmetsp:Transcript_32340/g.84952  ORF Transcript_32340/g.84952 Transcript_32340/m.84952 type:complete len:155 (+) Transcript_32340:1179-1643(+)
MVVSRSRSFSSVTRASKYDDEGEMDDGGFDRCLGYKGTGCDMREHALRCPLEISHARTSSGHAPGQILPWQRLLVLVMPRFLLVHHIEHRARHGCDRCRRIGEPYPQTVWIVRRKHRPHSRTHLTHELITVVAIVRGGYSAGREDLGLPHTRRI